MDKKDMVVKMKGPICPKCGHDESSRPILESKDGKPNISNVSTCLKCGHQRNIFSSQGE